MDKRSSIWTSGLRLNSSHSTPPHTASGTQIGKCHSALTNRDRPRNAPYLPWKNNIPKRRYTVTVDRSANAGTGNSVDVDTNPLHEGVSASASAQPGSTRTADAPAL